MPPTRSAIKAWKIDRSFTGYVVFEGDAIDVKAEQLQERTLTLKFRA
jgi:hypothetical protein